MNAPASPVVEPAPAARLTVVAELPAVRIEVLDGNLDFVLKGYGRVEGALPPGGYRVRWRAGLASEERPVLLRPGDDQVVSATSQLEFRSAAPMEGTRTSHEYQQGAAQEISQESPLALGRGAGLVLYVRDLASTGKIHPGADLTLHRADGVELVRLADVAPWRERDVRGRAASAGRSLEVDPGMYRLRVALAGTSAREMSIAACPGWQTQVFLVRQGGRLGRSDGRRLPDLDDAAVLMVPAGDHYRPWERVPRGFRPAEEAGGDLRLTELARKALVHGWRGIEASDLKAMLNGKWQDPMLGIYGLHLLLMQPEANLDTAAEIHERLRTDILRGFAHPDAVALAHEIARRMGHAPPETPPMPLPPMLRRSWAMLVAATAHEPELIPAGSLAATVGDRLAGGGAWLTWRWTPEIDGKNAATPRHLRGTPGDTAARAQPASAPTTGIEVTREAVIIDGLRLVRQPGTDGEPPVLPLDTASASGLAEGLPEGWEQVFAPAPESPTATATADAPPSAAQSIEALWQALEGRTGRRGALVAGVELDPSESALFAYLSRIDRAQAAAEGAADPLALAVLVPALGLPAATLRTASASLAAKLALASPSARPRAAAKR
jgi:hypothetical protein